MFHAPGVNTAAGAVSLEQQDAKVRSVPDNPMPGLFQPGLPCRSGAIAGQEELHI
jgi:hypothetical protein